MKLKECEHRVCKYNNKYLISEYGDLYSKFSKKYITSRRGKLGYHLVRLQGVEKGHDSRINKFCHRLVAEHWIDNPDNLEQVNHIDEDTSNNHYSNLQWMSREDNMDYSQSGTYYFKDPEGNPVEIFNLQRFCRENKLSAGNMHMVLDGKRNHHKGWTSNLPEDYSFHKRDDPLHGTKAWGWKGEDNS